MKLSILSRKVHKWAAVLAAAPLLVIIGTGLLLQLKKHATWVQPPERRGSGQDLVLSLPRVLEICQSVPEAEVRTWADVYRIDVRPSRGMLKVTAANNWEVQIDTATGEVLQVAYRRSDVIEAIHDGSWFHDAAKLWVFLPAGATLLLLWVTGLYLFVLPYWVKWRRPPRAAVAGRAADRV
jgi:uncharacterized iron-regulated membrane protein